MIKARVRFPVGPWRDADRAHLIVATAGLSGASPAGGGGSKGSLTVGSTNVAGDQVLGQVYGQALEKDGYNISYKENLGTREVVFQRSRAVRSTCFPTTKTRCGVPPGHRGRRQPGEERARRSAGEGIAATTPAPAVDVNGFYVTKKTAKKYKLEERVRPHGPGEQAHLRRSARM